MQSRHSLEASMQICRDPKAPVQSWQGSLREDLDQAIG